MSATDPVDMPFIDYVNAVEDEIESIYGLSISDAGIELEGLADMPRRLWRARPNGSWIARSTT